MESKRHTCIVCKKKRAYYKMKRFRSHWACKECLVPGDEPVARSGTQLRGLNLYAGLGGNRFLWPDSIHVTAVEQNPKVAAAYKKLFPGDLVIVGDAHKYLLKHFYEYDFIWSSPPCQSHTRLNFVFKNEKKRYADMSLYQEILLLRAFFKGRFVVENVRPYYEPLIAPDHQIGRHLFWSNFNITKDVYVPECPVQINWKQDSKEMFCAWLGFQVDERIYLNSSGNYMQVYRNCVHPLIGKSIFSDLVLSF